MLGVQEEAQGTGKNERAKWTEPDAREVGEGPEGEGTQREDSDFCGVSQTSRSNCFSSSSSFFFPDSFLRTGEVKSPSSEVPGVWAGSLEQKARLPELGQATPPCPFPALLLVEKVTHGATEAESSPISSPKCGDSTLPHIRSFLGPALTHPYAPFHVKLPLNNKELSAHSCPRGCDTFCRKGRCA